MHISGHQHMFSCTSVIVWHLIVRETEPHQLCVPTRYSPSSYCYHTRAHTHTNADLQNTMAKPFKFKFVIFRFSGSPRILPMTLDYRVNALMYSFTTTLTNATLPMCQVTKYLHHGLSLFCNSIEYHSYGDFNHFTPKRPPRIPACCQLWLCPGPREGADRGGWGSGFQAKLNSTDSWAQSRHSALR